MKIDIFSHIFPQKYKDSIVKVATSNTPALGRIKDERHAILSDLDARFKMMDEFEGYTNVLTLAEPPIEQIAESEKAVELARIANDQMAELVTKYPDRFVAAVAALPMNDVDSALKEVDRAINDLKLKGVQVYTSINDKPLDSPEFLPLYEKMSQYDLPIWIHPIGGTGEEINHIVSCCSWPHETSVAMARLVCSGILEKYPNLKFITHHCGGTIPYLAGRIAELGAKDLLQGVAKFQPLTREPIEYLKMFYGDTAIYGQVPALMCGYHFFGAEHMLFGTDMPLGSHTEPGIFGVRAAVVGIDQMEISIEEREKIYAGNARRLLCLP